ncbi:MAG: RNA-binding cell elongation regulator Jag/EloR [bacterium]
MQEATGTGRTLEEAIEQGLVILGADRDEVEVLPLETGRRGFLGLFGRRDAKVKVSVRPEDRIRTRVLMRNVLRRLGLDTSPDVQEEGDEIIVRFGEDASALIGHHGQTLDALQYLTSRIINSDREKWKKITIDIANYRNKREESLHHLSEQLAQQALTEGRDQRTEPLSAPERRIIHMTLRDHPKVTTFSVGDGSYRRVIVALREGVPQRQDRSSRPQRGRGRRGGRSQGAADGPNPRSGSDNRSRPPRRGRGGGRRGDSSNRNKPSPEKKPQ